MNEVENPGKIAAAFALGATIGTLVTMKRLIKKYSQMVEEEIKTTKSLHELNVELFDTIVEYTQTDVGEENERIVDKLEGLMTCINMIIQDDI